MSTIEPPLIITVAPNGARRGPADHPALPITPGELAATARDCLQAGAAMLHLHVRDGEGRHTLDADAYRDALRAVRDAVGNDLVVQITTEAVGRFTSAEQMALVRALRPEAVSLALRELIPDAAAEPAAASFFAWLAGTPILPQIILYSAADVTRYRDLRARGVLTGERLSALFVLGRYADDGAAVPRDLLAFLAAWGDEDAPWASCAFGPREHACCAAAAALGGDVRVGFENNLALCDGRTAPDNAALVAQMRALADALGRPVADAAAARRALGAPP